jgi:hypothetical protein
VGSIHCKRTARGGGYDSPHGAREIERKSRTGFQRSTPARLRLGLGFVALGLASCASQPRVVAVSIAALESAAEVGPILTERSIVTDADALRPFYVALGPRMGLVQVHSAADWDRLREAAPEIGTCPNLARGSVIGIVCRTGTPLDGDWPIELDAVRIADGAGFVCASFHGGSYLPDGSAFLETTYVEGLNSVLMVDVNGVRFYTD